MSTAGEDVAQLEQGHMLAGKYRVERVLGRGGMGVVYEAWHEMLDQRVAVKLLLPEIARDEECVRRFMNEARAAARIQNEHVARVMDVGVLEDGVPFMVMELLLGTDLGQQLEAKGALPVTEAVDDLMQAIEGVAHAHAVGIVHRDLKPPNVFVARRPDGSDVVKVLDFGISKVTGHASSTTVVPGNVTSTTAVIGSPAYMSPEQLRSAKNVDARTDIWSIGVMAYELLTGMMPFEGENVVAIFAVIMEQEPRPLRAWRPDIPEGLERAVLRCLRRNPDDRFATVGELAHALAPFGTRVSALALERIERLGVAAARTSRSAAVPAVSLPAPAQMSTVSDARTRRNRVLAVLAGVLGAAVIAAVVAVIVFFPRSKPVAVPAVDTPSAGAPSTTAAAPPPSSPAANPTLATAPATATTAGAAAVTTTGAPPAPPPPPPTTAVRVPPPATTTTPAPTATPTRTVPLHL